MTTHHSPTMIHIRGMTFEDLTLGLRLKQQAGWNQTAADWARFLTLQPDGCFVAEHKKAPAGTVIAFEFGPVGWIGLLLVDQKHRGAGIGKALLRRAVLYLEDKGVKTIRLDATPQGEPLYRGLGFAAQFTVLRFGGEMPKNDEVAGVEEGTQDEWDACCRLDEAVTRTKRRPLLLALFRERPRHLRVVRRGGAVVGFVAARPGTRALHVGPCIATAEAAPLLLADACRRYAGRPAFLDVPESNSVAVKWVREHGFTVQRQLLRMCRGDKVEEYVPQLWCGSGPEKG